MNRLKKIGRSVISSVLIAGLLMTSTAIAPMTVAPAQAIAPLTIIKTGLGGLGSIASSVGPSLIGKILNMTGNSELADFFGLNKDQNLEEIQKGVEELEKQIGDISDQIDGLGEQIDSQTQQLQAWITLSNFKSEYGSISAIYKGNFDTIERLMDLEDQGDISPEDLQRQTLKVMQQIYNSGDSGNLYNELLAMGNELMNASSSSPTAAYYENLKRVDGITRDELFNSYVNFTTSVYQDYVLSLMFCNSAMAYMADAEGGNVQYELQIVQLSEQAQQVLAYLVNERERLFPTNSIDGYDGALPDPELVANDYNAVYENGKVKTLEQKNGTKINYNDQGGVSSKEYFCEPTTQYVQMNVGEASAVKVYRDGYNVVPDGTFTTSDPTVAVVDQFGGIFATGVGTAELTFKFSDRETVNIQVDVVDVTEDGTPITSTTGELTKDVTSSYKASLNDLLKDAGLEDVSANDFTWTTTDPNSVTVDGENVKGVAKGGGYSMVIGTRQVRYDTAYSSSKEIQQVVFPFYVDYATPGETMTDYDDLMYHGTNHIDGTLEAELSASTPYGQLIAETKVRTPLDSFSLDGNGHSIDLMGITLMDKMDNVTVEELSIYSTTDLDTAAIIDVLPASGTIKNCDLNVNINGDLQYLGSAANQSQGRIEGVNFRGNITNTYDKDAGNIVGKGDGCSTIPYEGTFSTSLESHPDDNYRAFEYPTGTGGIVGRQDVNATKDSQGNWKVDKDTEDTGVYNCYLPFSGYVNGYTNVGGIVGLAVGDWTAYDEYWSDPVDNVAPNAAYVKIYASASEGHIQATDDRGAGIAGGIVGWSVFADINGASVQAHVNRAADTNPGSDNTVNGRTAGVSGIYLPAFTRMSIFGGMYEKQYDKGVGFKMENCVVDTSYVQDVKSGSDVGDSEWGQNAFFFNREYLIGMVATPYKDISKSSYEDRNLYWDAISLTNNYITYDIYYDLKADSDELKSLNAALKEATKDYEFKPMPDSAGDIAKEGNTPFFTTTREDGLEKSFEFKETYVYGEPIVPVSVTNVPTITYVGPNGYDSTEPPTEVGTYTAYDSPSNSGHDVTDTFTITPRTVKIEPPTETTLTYNGRQRTIDDPYISNLVPGDDVSLEIKEGTNKGKDVGEYQLVVTGLAGNDAKNYRIENNEYTMDWSIIIPDQKPSTIELTMNDEPVSELTLYYNGEKNSIDLDESIVVSVKDKDGNKYYGDEPITWDYDGECAELDKNNVLTALAKGSGTLTAQCGDATATIKVTIAENVGVSSINQDAEQEAAYVRTGETYDLAKVPLKALDNNGEEYILTPEEMADIQWKVTDHGSTGLDAKIDGTSLVVNKVDLDDNKETKIVLQGKLYDTTFNVELTIRQPQELTAITLTPVEEGTITLKPNTKSPLSEYISIESVDQYGDPMDPKLEWKSSDDTIIDVTTIDGAWYLAAGSEGYGTIQVSSDEVNSNEIKITVAGAPRLTSLELSDVPEALAWNATIDLNALTVKQLDQFGNEMATTGKVYWKVMNDEDKTNASISNQTTLNAGTGRGTITLIAEVNRVTASKEIAVGPTVETLSVEPASLSAKGGAVTATLSGKMLSAGIIVGLFADGEDTPAVSAQTSMAGEACQAVLNVPANESDADVTYTVKISYDGKTFEKEPSATVIVAKPSHDPAVTDLSIDKNAFDSKGGEMTVSLKGENLTEAPTVALFDGDKLVKSGATSENEGTYTATLAVPENTSTSDKTYTVKVSIDGKTYLDKPTASLTVEGKSGGNIGGGGGGGIIIPPLNDDHEVTIEQPDNGKIETSDDKAEAGDEVTITVTPDDGYVVDKIAITDEDGNEIEVTDNGDGTFTFSMPDSDISIEAEFVEEGGEEPPVIDLPFTDVADDAWYAGPVQFVYEQGLMTGVSETDFGPNLTTTRGMIVTMLYRLQGEPEVGESAFTDVNPDAYYADAVTWAAENDIVSGYGSGNFGPNDAITREQLAAILYRYCEAMGYEISARSDLSAYSDADSISSWATDVISWAHAMGLINGVSKTELAPQATATRAQVAAILERFLTIDWEA